MFSPLADRMRPETLDEMVGQSHLLAPGKPLRNILESGEIPNLIFYGPSGIGKTTLASIIAKQTKRKLHRLNATTASTADIKDMVAELDTLAAPNGILLYLDEIQYFNKKQQQSLLEHIENGGITLIASTTENPYFYIYNAILSRSNVFEFRPVTAKEMHPAINRAMAFLQEEKTCTITAEEGVLSHIAGAAGGDVRKALNLTEAAVLATKQEDGTRHLTMETLTALTGKSALRYDRDGDAHYDILSAFQKSLRGSDPDAALHYLARLLEAGDLPSVCRRLMVCACEDVGLAYPMIISIVKSAVDAALQVGLPEARIPLADAVILVCTSPKSNSGVCAVDAAIADVKSGNCGEIPEYLKDSHYPGAAKLGHGLTYQYPHSFPDHYIAQQYLPDAIRDHVYYHPAPNKNEQAAKAYWDTVKSKSNGKKESK